MTSSFDTPPAEPTGAPTTSLPAGHKLKGALREFLETAALALIIFLLVRVVVMNYRVIGQSMEPTIHDGQYLFIDKLFYAQQTPQRGDIIVLRPPATNGNVIYLKRVIGLPGETVEIRSGEVLIDGRPLVEPWTTIPFPQANWGPGKVGPNEVFVLGDNRPGSRDSRYFGMLTRDRIVGRAFLCYWPPSAWTIYPRYNPS